MLPLRLVDELFLTPVITVPQAQERLNVTHRTANNTVQRLVDAGVLQQIPGRQRARQFVASDILHILANTNDN